MMSKLLSANLMRLKKDKVFWIAFGFMFAAGIIFPVMIMCFFTTPCLLVFLWRYFAASLSEQNIVMERFGTKWLRVKNGLIFIVPIL